jgi:hypothetical protein
VQAAADETRTLQRAVELRDPAKVESQFKAKGVSVTEKSTAELDKKQRQHRHGIREINLQHISKVSRT